MTSPSFLDALAPDQWPVLLVAGTRFVGIMVVDPLWGMASIPGNLRTALVALFALAALPAVQGVHLPTEFAALIGPLAAELMIGLAIGLTSAVFMAGMSLAGEVVSVQMGLNLAATITGSPEDNVGGVGEIQTRFASSLYVALGGHLMLLNGVAHSLVVIPPGSAINLTQGGQTIMMLAGTVFSTAARVAAPVLVTLLLVNLTIAILARAMPQLQSFAIAFPITIGLGLVVFGTALPALGQYVTSWTGDVPRTVGQIISGFAIPAGGH